MPSAAVKVVTVRVPLDEAERVELIARASGVSVNDVFRRAVDCYTEQLRADEDFVARTRAMLAREAEIAEQLL